MLDFITGLSFFHIICVLLGFSLLIFVHELGHFLAARAVGVRVERFMIGIDAWGWGLHRKIGDTEYGIGLLPFGGYVKLAGQSDLPGEEQNTGAPDELMSKGPWARMLVFVAGVIMNFILGFVILVVVALMGVPRVTNIVGTIPEGSPAANAGLKPMDRILQIDGQPVRWWKEDILMRVAFSDGTPMNLLVARGAGDTATTFRTTVRPRPSAGRGNLYMIHAMPFASRTVDSVMAFPKELPFLREHMATISDSIHRGDEVVAVDGTPVENQSDFEAYCGRHPGTRVNVTLLRNGERHDVTVAVPVVDFGRYEIGARFGARVTPAPDSPAAKAGMAAGTLIAAVNGKPLGMEATQDLTHLIQTESYGTVDLTVLRAGAETTVRITPRPRDAALPSASAATPDTFIGVTLTGGTIVEKIIPGGPADGVLQPGDRLLRAGTQALDAGGPVGSRIAAAALRELDILCLNGAEEKTLRIRPAFSAVRNMAMIGVAIESAAVATVEPGSPAETMGLERGDRALWFELSQDLSQTRVSWTPARAGSADETRRSATIPTPQAVLADPFAAGLRGQSGLVFTPYTEIDRVPTFGAALEEAAVRGTDMALTVYRMLHKLVSGRMSITATGGPILIFQAMYSETQQGFTRLLDLLALISINLAVLNILPLPVLDGGHCLFLFIEMLKGTPPHPRIREYAHYAGFFLIVGFFLVVMGIDIYYVILGGRG